MVHKFWGHLLGLLSMRLGGVGFPGPGLSRNRSGHDQGLGGGGLDAVIWFRV